MRVSVAQTLQDLRPLVEPVAERRHVGLVFDGCDVLPATEVDGLHVGRLLYKLIVRAIKATPLGGSVRVSAGVIPMETAVGSGRWLQIAVADTGTGITQADFDRVFHGLEPVEIVGARQEGAGFSLAVACQLGQLPGARLSMDVRAGQGCTFAVKLPAV